MVNYQQTVSFTSKLMTNIPFSTPITARSFLGPALGKIIFLSLIFFFFVLFRCKPLLSEFSDLPARSTRKRKNQRITRSGRSGGRTRKDESSEDSESEDEEVCFVFVKNFLC
jgi:hypothetical protein